jgi:hypothetical protein
MTEPLPNLGGGSFCRESVRQSAHSLHSLPDAAAWREPAEQWVLSGGPYTVSSHVRHVHVVCPPP